MLRRLIVLLLMFVMAVPACAGAEKEAMFPAFNEQELWGYINARGEWVIEPQYDHALDFYDGDYAIAEMERGYGIIDRQGKWVVDPYYSFDFPSFWGKDGFAGNLVLLYEDEEQPDGGYDWVRIGFFDIESGYFSGMRDDWYIYPRYTESDLIPVDIHDAENDRDLLGYVNRRNGELAVPYRYDPGTDPTLFHDGVAHVYDYDETDVDMEEDPIGHLIDEQGNTVPLEEGLQIRYGTDASCGRILVQDTATGLYGYVDTRGKLVIPAVYPECGEFRMNRAWVRFNDTENGMIDIDGNEIIRSDRIEYILIADAACGYAEIWFVDETEGWISMDGRITDKVSTWAMPVQENRFWEEAGEGFWYLTDEEGNVLSKNYKLDKWDENYYFSDGLACVQGENGLWGYVNEDGQEVIPCRWERVNPFYEGIAWVSIDNKMAYIDREGKVVWQEK